MSERLYYENAYLQSFAAHVLERLDVNGKSAVVLDRSAFYPTSGGQPHDTGWLQAVGADRVAVVDVQVREGDGAVLHILERPLLAEQVTGQIDWKRRFDHMQQHTGQHILSQAFIQVAEAETVAFHLGNEDVTIDLAHPPLNAEELAAVEERANWAVAAALLVATRFVTAAELAQIPLRRTPKVTENIRIVEIRDFDWSACGGTHVATSAEVGLIKILKAERRGKETRIEFVCGGRALADYARKGRIVQSLIAQFTCSEDELPDAVAKVRIEAESARRSLRAAELQIAEARAAQFYAQAETLGGQRVVCQAISDLSADAVRSLAQSLQAQEGCVVLLAWAGAERTQLFFGRNPQATADMNALMRAACAAVSGKGGGRPDWAQGNAPAGQVEAALKAALAALHP